MKNTRSVAVVATVFAVMACASAHAQTKPVETAPVPPPRYEMDPAKRIPAAAPPAPVVKAEGQAAASTGYRQQPSTVTSAQPYADSHDAAATYEDGRGGFFIGVQGGKGWVTDDVDQSARSINAGYRWQAGAVTLIGVEVASGKLQSAVEDGWRYAGIDHASVGVNARFNFGATSPVYALVRAGYWTADADYGIDVDGGYVGLGLGVDFNRHFNMSLVYTNHVYFEDYYWDDGDFYYDANRADTLMLGAEVRF